MDADGIEIQIVELLRLEFNIEQDVIKLEKDLVAVRHQRELLEAQLKLAKNQKLSPEE